MARSSDGDCAAGDFSLREAINTANTVAGADTITFDNSFLVPRVITINQGPLLINSDLTIHGGGAGLLTISGNNASRVFTVDDSLPSIGTVLMTGMRITAGNSLDGGGIFNAENLTLQAVSISGNLAQEDGGGILNGGVLTVENSAVSGNSAAGNFSEGGGVFNSGTCLAVVWISGHWNYKSSLPVSGTRYPVMSTQLFLLERLRRLDLKAVRSSGITPNGYHDHIASICCSTRATTRATASWTAGVRPSRSSNDCPRKLTR